MRILAFDTSTECCSAALLLGPDDVRLRSVITERGHAELILPMIDALLAEAGVRLADLDGLAFGRGPGAFTGLRVAAGVAQGLAIGSGLKVAPVSSLAAVAAQVPAAAGAGSVLVCNDARMGEIYWAQYGRGAEDGAPVEQWSESVTSPDRVRFADEVRHLAGNALVRYPQLAGQAQARGWHVHEGLYPQADVIARLGALTIAAGRGVGAEQALPTYVRDDVARPAGGTVTGMS